MKAKNLKNMKNLILFLSAFSLFACEKTIDFDLPTEKAQLAVSSQIIDGDSIYATVSISSAALSGNPSFSDKARILLFENDVLVDSLTLSPGGVGIIGSNVPVYTSSYSCTPGRKYTIKVSQANFETVEGSCIMPETPSVSNGEYISANYTIKGSISDPSGLGDIYKIQLKRGQFKEHESFFIKDLTIENYQGYSEFFEDETEGTFATRAYIRDELFDGSIRDFELNYSEWNGANLGTDSLFLKISALSTDQYEFEKDLDISEYAEAGPFSEPVPISSNMSNQKGNFGASNSIYLALEKK
tara:strand:- start:100579 stop:101478 length:900 start_codon:yes stop_codon:yes gene_type:complete